MAKTGVFSRRERTCERQRRIRSQGTGKEVREMEGATLFYFRAPGQYYQISRRKRLKHTGFLKKAIHFWQKSTSFSEAIEKVDYDVPGEMNTSHPWRTDLMSSTLLVPQEKVVFNVRRGKSGFELLIRPGQKNIACMKDILQKFMKPGNLVVDTCARLC